ncbi:HzsA-related protein [Luteimonas sp. RIT-PG2_3]
MVPTEDSIGATRRPLRALALLASVLLLSACELPTLAVTTTTAETTDQDQVASGAMVAATGSIAADAVATTASTPTMAAATTKAASIQNPIMFVTQVPTPGDTFGSRTSTFANHQTSMAQVPRGGDLMIRYANGTLRNLTKEAGFGMEGQQGANAIAVREPTVHWNGTKAIFSMLVGAPAAQYASTPGKWQLYEVTGLALGQTASVTKVANQPTGYNNVSPLYTSDGRILFTSDRPRGGESHLYPQLDEYESTPTVTGIFSLNPASGELTILNHAPSGAFSPTIDSYGRVIFTRWDHLQRDQQAEVSSTGAHDYASEASTAAKLTTATETFPEPRTDSTSTFGGVTGHMYNLFSPWQMNQDGTFEQTLNHIGRHETSFSYVPQSFTADTALTYYSNNALFANRLYIRHDGGLFHLREDPLAPGTYYGINAREFSQGTTNQIVRITGAPTLNAEQMVITAMTPNESGSSLAGGRYRNPLPLTSGQMVAAYTSSAVFQSGATLRLHQLDVNASGQFVTGNALTPGISKNLTWWTPDSRGSYNGLLWELEPVEVVARTPPPAPTLALKSPESSVLTEELVDETSLRTWMKANNLALIVVRNQTSRDRNDRQQPYNLQVPGGVKTVANAGRVYDISHFQIYQGEQVRAYNASQANGRRVIPRPLSVSGNVANAGGPPGSVKIAADGSSAAFVPARRALSWQTTDASGNAVVRERVWVTMQPGEIRACGGCHGENSRNQAGVLGEATNKPEALRLLLRQWKQDNASSAPIRKPWTPPLVH